MDRKEERNAGRKEISLNFLLFQPSLLRWLICEKKANPKGAILDAAATK